MSRHSGIEGYSESGDWLMGAIKRNPEGLLLLAAGCALMMRTGSASRRKERRFGREDYEPDGSSRYARGYEGSSGGWNAREGISRGVESASEYANNVKDSVSGAATSYASSAVDTATSYASSVADTASSYASSAADYAGAAGRQVSEQSGRIARQAQSTMQHTVNRVLQDQPLAVVLVGLAAGAAVAAAFPTTDIERRTLGDAGEKLTDMASKAGEQFKEGASKAGERLMSSVGEHPLSSDGLKEVARDVVGAFGSAFSDDQSNQSTQSNQSGTPAGRKGSSGSFAQSRGQSGPSSGSGSASSGQTSKAGQSQGFSSGLASPGSGSGSGSSAGGPSQTSKQSSGSGRVE
jgi:hypothetical protein